MGRRGYGGGGRWRVYTYRYTVTTRMTCIKMGSDESHFNVSLVVRNKVTRPCPQTTTFLKRKESRSGIEPRSFRLPAYRLTARPNRLSKPVCPVQCCFMSTETVPTVSDGEPRTSTSTFTQILSSVRLSSFSLFFFFSTRSSLSVYQ